MTCGRCGGDNPADKRFCGDCGAPLTASCPACASAVEPGRRFCGDCGSPVDPAAPEPAVAPRIAASYEPVAERRRCSVLFVDLVGFTAASADRDPEDVRELLSRYFEVARTVVGRYGGVIEKFIGDAVMAVWGTPVATEEDAERAVRAALDLVESVAQLGHEVGQGDLWARAGVVTGEVAVTLGAQHEGMVAGDVVNTASRIQAAAPAGAVFVDTVTKRLTGEAVDFRDEGEHELKGKLEPEHLWRAVRVVSKIGGEQRVDGLEASLIGRGAEFRAIRDMFHAAVDRRQSRMMLVSGVAGVGKSRLGWEFYKYVDGLADDIFWHRGRCLWYGEGLAYWALAETVRQRLGIGEEDASDLAQQLLTEGMERYVPDAAERAFIGIRLGRLLGVPYEGDSGATLSRADLFAGWRRFFEQLADVHPVVLVIEDAQHAAPELLEFLDHLVDWTQDLPVFVVVFARPEIDQTQPSFGSGRNRIHIALDSLDVGSMQAMVAELLPGAPDEAQRAIIERAQGIPLYAIESIRSLIDRDVVQAIGGSYRVVGEIGQLDVPDSLQSLLAARLDALDPLSRRVVTEAAVLGATFPVEAVAGIVGLGETETAAVLNELVRRGVLAISGDRLSPERGNYGFTQEMLRQVAYESLSRRDRKAKHLAVAEHLRTAFPNDGEEVIDVVARHYADAIDAVPDDVDVDRIYQLLVDALVRAGERSARGGSPDRAVECFRQAGDREEQAGRSLEAAALWLRACEASRYTSRFTTHEELADQAREVYLAAGEDRLAARALLAKARMRSRRGFTAEARGICAEAWDALCDERDEDLLDVAHQLASAHSFSGDAAEGERWSREALRLAHELRVDDRRFAEVLATAGTCVGIANQPRLAILLIAQAARLAEEAGDLAGAAQAYTNLADLLNIDRPVEAVDAANRAIELCEQTGNANMGVTAMVNLVLARLAVGEWDAAGEVLTDGALIRLVGDDDDESRVFRALFEAIRGDPAAGDEVDQAHDLVVSGDPQDRGEVALTRAFAAWAGGDAEAAFEHASVSVAVLRELPFCGDDGRWGWPLAARVAHVLGRYDAERELLAMFEELPVGTPAAMQRAEAALIRARLAAVDRDDGAGELFDVAISELRESSTPYHLAYGLLDHAEYLGVEDERAVVEIAEARAIADTLRCDPILRAADSLLGAGRLEEPSVP